MKANIGWTDAEVDEKKASWAGVSNDHDRIAVSAAYVYPMSRRTNLYGGAGWVQDSSNARRDCDPSAFEAVFGIVHRF